VCRRILSHHQDAEDAFQAAFLVLARKADTIEWRDSVSSWLYEVAYRLAEETRVKAARRAFHERRAAIQRRAPEECSKAGQELCALLDEELYRLPDRFRAPLLLCYMQGLTSDQAARQLGWSLRTLERRLAQGRERLRLRLARRGITLAAALLVPMLSASASSAAAPQSLIASTLQTASAFAAGVVGAPVPGAVLADGFLKGMAMTRWKLAALLALALCVTTGGGVLVQQTLAGRAPDDPPKQVDAKKQASEADAFPPQAWDILEVLGKQHFEPRPRGEMILAGLRSLRAAAEPKPEKGKQPDLNDEKLGITEEVRRRAAAVETKEQFTALLKALWPTESKATREALEEAFISGVAKDVGGDLRVIPFQEMKVAEQVSANRYIGIGIQIKMHDTEKLPQILNPFRRGPAYRAGIKPNDLIVQVNDKEVKGLTIAQVVDLIRDEEGTSVRVTVRQPGSTETRTYTMTRAPIPFDTIVGCRRISDDAWSYRPDPDSPIGYVRLAILNAATLHDLRKAEQQLRADGCKAVILDLRHSHSQGELRHAAMVADGLLDGGLMWTSRGKDEATRKEYRADRECLFRDWPMVALIDDSLDRTHSLIGAALQDNGRAALVGGPTKMDGHVNTMVTLPDGKTGLIFRSGVLERPKKELGWPLKPDYEVGMDTKQQQALAEWINTREIAGRSDEAKPPPDPRLARAIEVLREKLTASKP
jgi:C-terminal peptidase prc